MDERIKLIGLGTTYGSHIKEEGNFETNNIITYRIGERPSELKSLYKDEHVKSIYFQNEYIRSNTKNFTTILE
jgi:hypothetical protein